MSWQTSATPADDPFAKAEADVRAMTSSQWWRTAAPPQRAEQVVSRLLAGPGEWWLFGAWGRWYRCGLDAHWHPSPPPADPAARRIMAPAPPGVGNPPVPPQLVPTGPDVAGGPMATAGLLAEGPSAELVARVQQALITAIAVDPQQFAMQDPAFQPGTPTTVAALWGAILFSSGTPVVLTEHPLVAMFAPYLTVQAEQLRWMIAPDLTRLAVYYTDRLSAGDPVGASFLVRMMGEVASALATDPAFQPGASALASVCAITLQYVQADLQAIPYGTQNVAREWLRRCPAEYAAPIVREASPGEYLRLALYDLAVLFGELTEGIPPHPSDLRRAAAAIMAADLQTIPQAVSAVLPWLDQESSRTVQEVLGQAQHPLRELFPQGVRLPPKLSSTDPARVRALLATTHALAMTACRLAQLAPQHLEFIVPAACAAELGTPALSRPKATGELTAWEIINAARKHLADERSAAEATPPPAPSPLPAPASAPSPLDDDPFATRPGSASAAPPAAPSESPVPAAAGPDQPAPVHDPFGEHAPEVPHPSPYGTTPPPSPAIPPYQPPPFGQPYPGETAPPTPFNQQPPGPFGQPPAAPYPGGPTSPAGSFGQPPATPYSEAASSPPDPFGQQAPGPFGQPPMAPSPPAPFGGQSPGAFGQPPVAPHPEGAASGSPDPFGGQSPGGFGQPPAMPYPEGSSSPSDPFGGHPSAAPYPESAASASPGAFGQPPAASSPAAPFGGQPPVAPYPGEAPASAGAFGQPPVAPYSEASADPFGQQAPGGFGQSSPSDPFGGQSPGAFGQSPVVPPYPGEGAGSAEPVGGQAGAGRRESPGATSPYMPTFATRTSPPVGRQSSGASRDGSGAGRVVEAYGVRFLCGADDVERMLTEVRRRGKWAQQLRGQEVSSASAPAVLLVGAPSTGQRRLARMIARSLAEVGFSGDQVRTLHLEQIRERGPEGLGALLSEHSGHTVLLEGLDELLLDDGQGDAYSRALYRVRAEGVTDTTLVAGCSPERFDALSSAHPELITDFRTVRLPDLGDGEQRAALLALLAEERYVGISDEAWPIVHRDLTALPGRGRLINARLVEAYLDRACTRHLGTADATVAVMGERGFTLTPSDLEGLAAELPR